MKGIGGGLWFHQDPGIACGMAPGQGESLTLGALIPLRQAPGTSNPGIVSGHLGIKALDRSPRIKDVSLDRALRQGHYICQRGRFMHILGTRTSIRLCCCWCQDRCCASKN